MAKKTGLFKQILVIGASVLALIFSVGAIAKANNVDKTQELSAFNYTVAGVRENGTTDKEDKTSIVSDMVTVDGLTIDFVNDEESNVTVSVHFYDEDKKYISSSAELTEDTEVEAVENAKYAKIQIETKEGVDEDGEISYFEMLEYLKELKVTVNK